MECRSEYCVVNVVRHYLLCCCLWKGILLRRDWSNCHYCCILVLYLGKLVIVEICCCSLGCICSLGVSVGNVDDVISVLIKVFDGSRLRSL